MKEKIKRQNIKYNNEGISLIALIVTIVLMLLLATVTINLVFDGGLFNYAGKAKLASDEADIIEKVENAYIIAKGKNKNGTTAKLEDLQEQINIALPDKNIEIAKEGSGFILLLGGKYIEITNNGTVNAPKEFEKIDNAGDITKGGTCTGTQDNPYKIECIEDLVALAELTNKKDSKIASSKYYLIVNDLDFNSIFSYSNYKAKYIYNSEADCYEPDLTGDSGTGIKELCTTGQGFIPIGLEYSNGNNTRTFRGTLYGEGEKPKTISNIYMKRSGEAALCCGGYFVTIRNIAITGNITSTDSGASGILRNAYKTTLQKCYNKAKITGTGATGIFGGAGSFSGIMTECGNEGEIIATNGSAAGLCSGVGVSMKKCYNKGNVTGTANAVGIDFSPTGGTQVYTNCYNSGKITAGTGTCCAAGLSYWRSGATYNNCYNTGNITGASVRKPSWGYGVAGLIPTAGNYVVNTTNCYSSGLLTITNISGDKGGSAILVAGDNSVRTNCYYLNTSVGSTGLTPRTGETVFYKTSADASVANDTNGMTTENMVTTFNNYIQNPPEGETTTGWCKWVIGDNNLPALDFNTEWNGTTWVSTNN